MQQPLNQPTWWDLHLRKARGEALSEAEQQCYDAALARQDQEAPPLKSNLELLKTMRQQMLFVARDNKQLQGRLIELNREIHLVEQALSQETQSLLGVGR